MSESQSIRQLIQRSSSELTPSERRLASLLSGANPVVALGSVHQLAKHARISAPTVVRFAMKLGFSGYTEFQRAWVSELESSLRSPLTLLDKDPSSGERTFGERIAELVRQATDQELTFEPVITLLSEPARRVYVRGGRFSQPVAEYLYAHLREIRGNTEILNRGWTHDIDATVDMGKRDIVVLFDFRRYQPDTEAFAQRVAQQGVTVILFTDRWQSPAAALARHVLTSDIASGSPYDSLVPAMAQVEFVAMGLLERLDDRATQRLRKLESARATGEKGREADIAEAKPLKRESSKRKAQ